MPDMEKVISDLEEQITWIRDNDFHKFPGWGHAVIAMQDALALLEECHECGEATSKVIQELQTLLKAQEPVKPLKMTVEHVRKEPVVFSYECPVCMCGLQRHWVACPICGTKVKWE